MPQSLGDWWEFVILTLRDPRSAARLLVDWQVPNGPRWAAFFLIVTLSSVATHLFLLSLDPLEREFVRANFPGPISFAVLQAVAWLLMVGVTFGAARAFGGKGRFADVLLTFTWLQAVVFLFQVAQIVIGGILPTLGSMIGVASMIVFLWLFTVFTTVVHKFDSAWTTFAGIIAGIFVIGIFIAALSGLGT